MVNWKEYGVPFENFTEEITQKWIDEGFSYEECQNWINVLGEEFEVDDYDFCAWLRDEKHLTTETLCQENIDELIEEYNEEENENWKDIHPEFSEELQKEWESRGFSYEQTKKWVNSLVLISLSNWTLKLDADLDFCVWSRDIKKINAEKINNNNIIELWKEYELWDLWKKNGFTPEQTKKWIDIGLDISDCSFAFYLIRKGYQPQDNLNLEELRKEYDDKSQNSQDWLDKNYPKEKRKWVSEIYLTELTLEGELDLKDFTYEYGVKVYISPEVDESKLIWKNKSEKTEIIIQVQEYLNQQYPTQEQREQITKLDIKVKCLHGELDLSDFINLKELNCLFNELTSLNVINCFQLERIDCGWNSLTSLDVSKNDKLTELNCHSNRLTNLDVSNCLHLTNLDCSHNKLTNIPLLPNPTNLKRLDLRNNNFSEQKINQYGWCWKCQQLNTSQNWCQPCAEKEWQEDLKSLTGQELIEKFIEQQGKDWEGEDKLQWIPYEKFSNIEPIGVGGFSKIYKAEWEGESRYGKIINDVVLKSLNNSQNITLEFLTEITNNKLLSGGNIIYCYGISQDPETKNYVMVMHYMEGGNLKEYLKSKYREMSLEDKLDKLRYIASGLNSIHEQNLLHRDFHSGNILSNKGFSFIADLGLSCPANHQKDKGEIFGVLPYIAPEVLRGQPYTQKSDIYSFGMVFYEFLSNTYPYPEMDEIELMLGVCFGKLRPNLDKAPLPQELKDLIKRCWEVDTKKRPSAEELFDIIGGWLEQSSFIKYKIKKNTSFYLQYKEVEQEYNQFSQNTPYQIHPTATTTSKMIDTKKITELLSKDFSLELKFQNAIDSYQTKELDFDIETPTSTQKLSKRFRSMSMEETNQKEIKSIKLDKIVERQEYFTEPMEMNDNDQFSQQIDIENLNLKNNQDWTNIHSSFTNELIQQWQSLSFTYQQTRDWINIGLQPTDYNFCAWLRDNKHFTPEQVLNHHNREQLNQEFFTYWQGQQQNNIEIPPKNS